MVKLQYSRWKWISTDTSSTTKILEIIKLDMQAPTGYGNHILYSGSTLDNLLDSPWASITPWYLVEWFVLYCHLVPVWVVAFVYFAYNGCTDNARSGQMLLDQPKSWCSAEHSCNFIYHAWFWQNILILANESILSWKDHSFNKIAQKYYPCLHSLTTIQLLVNTRYQEENMEYTHIHVE